MNEISSAFFSEFKAQLWVLPRTQASFSTATGLFYTPESRPRIFIGTFGDPTFDGRLEKILIENPNATVSNFILVDNDVSDYMTRARKTIIRLIHEEYPAADDIRSIIDDSGTALENQMGRDPTGKTIDKKTDVPLVIKRMKLLAIPEGLINEYRELHRYYISKKHADSEDLLVLKNEIASPSGLRIAISFFEKVRSILISYYSTKGMPLPTGIEKINYSKSKYSDMGKK